MSFVGGGEGEDGEAEKEKQRLKVFVLKPVQLPKLYDLKYFDKDTNVSQAYQIMECLSLKKINSDINSIDISNMGH